jgi:hypothetical protein
MKLFKNKVKKIKFYSDKTHLDLLKPIPSSRIVPDWWRKIPGSIKGSETIKKCIPVLDSLTAGYVIPLPADVVWDENRKIFITQGKFQINSDHYMDQIDGIPIPPEYDRQPHKWINSWYVKTPPGYSTLFTHPLNRLDLPFYSFSGVVDTDKHPLIVNFPFVFKDGFKGIIPAGTPMIQAIPFKRDDWESESFDSGEPYVYDKQWQVQLPPFAWYKRNFWKKKRYS